LRIQAKFDLSQEFAAADDYADNLKKGEGGVTVADAGTTRYARI